MSFGGGSDYPEDRYGGSAQDANSSDSIEILEDEDQGSASPHQGGSGSEQSGAEDIDDGMSDESHPEAAEALRALDTYRGEQQEPNASDYSDMDDEESDQSDQSDQSDEIDKEIDNEIDNGIGNDQSNAESDDDNAQMDRPTSTQSSEKSEHVETLRRLEAEVHELEAAQWELQRQLHQARLQADAARAAQERQAVAAAEDAEALRRLRATSSRERASADSRLAEQNARAESYKAEADAKERAYNALRTRFNEQSTALADVRAQVVELQRERAKFDVQVLQATRSEARAQRQLGQLREELGTALDEAAEARAELDLQTHTMAEIRAQAREEALAALVEDLETNKADRTTGATADRSTIGGDRTSFAGSGEFTGLALDEDASEGIWRKQYVALRKQMDAVAAEFERREPEIFALQEAHDQAEARLAEASEAVESERKQREKLEKELRSGQRRIADLTVQQQLTESTLADLRRQLLVLLTEKLLDSTGEAPLSPEDEDELARLREQIARSNDPIGNGSAASMDGQHLITERLLLFKDVAELQFQNEALLKACRELASQLDPSGDATAAALAAAQHSASEDIQAATEALEAMQQKYKQLQHELSAAREAESHFSADSAKLSEKNKALNAEVQSLRTQLKQAHDKVIRSSSLFVEPEQQQLQQQSSSGSAVGATNSSSSANEEILRLQVNNAEARLKDMQLEAAQLRDETRSISQQLSSTQVALGRAEQRSAAAEANAAATEARLTNVEHELSVLNREKQLWTQREQQLLAQLAAAQTEAEAAQRRAGRGQAAAEELQKQLLQQMGKIEALVASNSGEAPYQLEETERALNESRQRYTELEKKTADLQALIASKSEEVSTLRSEYSSKSEEFETERNNLKSKNDALEQHITHLKAETADLKQKIDELIAEADQKAAKAAARDEELVEQVNALEDQLTEARDYAKQLKHSQEQEAAELHDKLKIQISDEVTRDLTSKLTAELQTKLREEIKAELTENGAAPSATGAAPTAPAPAPSTLSPEDRNRLESELREQITTQLQSELRQSLRPEVESQLKAELVPQLSSEIRSRLEKEIREEIKATVDESSASEDAKASSLSAGSTSGVSGASAGSEVSSGMDISTDAGPELSEESSRLPLTSEPDTGHVDDGENLGSLRKQLEEKTSVELVSKFEKAVLHIDRSRVKEAFKRKLDAARAESQQHGEDVATKRSEIRTKLQNQKIMKLEQTKLDLEAQVEDLRTKVRRLKGGAVENLKDTATPSSSNQGPQQQQPVSWSFSTQPASAFLPQAPASAPFAAFPSAFPSTFADSQKRSGGSFEESDAKKRKE